MYFVETGMAVPASVYKSKKQRVQSGLDYWEHSISGSNPPSSLSVANTLSHQDCPVMGSRASAPRLKTQCAKCTAMSNEERTFIAIKPDGVQRRLVGDIIKRFELKGFKLVGMKFIQAPESLLKKHYADLKDRPFFPGLVSYMASGPVVAMVWEGLNVVKTGRVMLGETNPADSKPGTIRGDYCIQVGRNIIHGSDSVESANKEINLWFKPEELCSYTSCSSSWLY
uniref:Nucleoside diphosphate kinase n=2 Tax=Oncorhynchus mykiss TaxID=8022 RepID=A0A8K9UQL4_ONCMY